MYEPIPALRPFPTTPPGLARALQCARRVQKRLLRTPIPRLDAVELHGACLPARELGGDYYDVIASGPGRLGLALGDVSGKGIPAALMLAVCSNDGRQSTNTTLVTMPRTFKIIPLAAFALILPPWWQKE